MLSCLNVVKINGNSSLTTRTHRSERKLDGETTCCSRAKGVADSRHACLPASNYHYHHDFSTTFRRENFALELEYRGL